MGDTTTDQTTGAAPPAVAMGMTGRARTWGAIVVSIGITIGFVGSVTIILFKAIPEGSDAIANVLLGTLAAMQTQVTAFWIGSSAGSASKDQQKQS